MSKIYSENKKFKLQYKSKRCSTFSVLFKKEKNRQPSLAQTTMASRVVPTVRHVKGQVEGSEAQLQQIKLIMASGIPASPNGGLARTFQGGGRSWEHNNSHQINVHGGAAGENAEPGQIQSFYRAWKVRVGG